MKNEEIKKELLQIYECKHDFTVTQTGKKHQKVNGFYKPNTQEIFLHNKNFTTDNQLIYTAIHELTHHILKTEYKVKTARCHSGAFWSTFYNLLDKAVELGFYSRKRSDSVQSLIDDRKRRVKMYYSGGVWHAKDGDKVFESKDFKECWLFAMGYGCDHASELRYLMAQQKIKEKKGFHSPLRAEKE